MKSQRREEVAIGGRKTATSLSEQETVAPIALVSAPQMPPIGQLALYEQQEHDGARSDATGGLAIILGQLVAYFTNRAHIDDLDVLSFSLHHLFCRVDFLYNITLPAFATWTKSLQAGQ